MKKTKPTKTVGNKPTLIAFLLDRSGSMDSCKKETIGGFNGYIKELRKKENGTARFTLTQFDTVSIDIVHDSVPLKDVKELNNENYQPRGGTPLYDAIGKTIRAADAQAGTKYKVLFVVQTDGEENSSSEWTKDRVQSLMKEMENDKHWTFAFIGMGPDGWSQTQTIAFGTRSGSNVMRATGATSGKAYSNLAKASVMFCASGAKGMTCSDTSFFTEDEKDATS